MRRERRVAVAADREQERAFCRGGGRCRLVLDGGEERARPRVIPPALEREGALAHGRQELVDREGTHPWIGQTQPLEPGRSQDERIDLAAPPLAQARVDVAPQRHDLEVAPPGEQLGTPANARGADARAERQPGEPTRAVAEQHVVGTRPRRDRAHHETEREAGGQVLHGMHTRVDRAGEQRFLDLLHEEPLHPAGPECALGPCVPARTDEDHLDPEPRVGGLERGSHPIGLCAGEGARARTEAKPGGVHAATPPRRRRRRRHPDGRAGGPPRCRRAPPDRPGGDEAS